MCTPYCRFVYCVPKFFVYKVSARYKDHDSLVKLVTRISRSSKAGDSAL